MENEKFLKEQIITYLGNKRKLLDFIGESILDIMQKENLEKAKIFDGFSGSGVVSRYLKRFSSQLYTNDFEEYTSVINSCYLTNKSDVPFEEIERINNWLNENKLLGNPGFIRKYYSPKDDNNITKADRAFYTNKNALIIDTLRDLISQINPNLQKYFIAPLLYCASVHTNTSGVFKGFYKDKITKKGKFGGTTETALTRITGEIDLPIPIFSEYECDVTIYNKDTNLIVKEMPQVDITYYDPPYNQHPYGSNYFMLNLIYNRQEPDNVSKVSGIPTDWKKSPYYKKNQVKKSFEELIKNTPSKWILISYNNEGLMGSQEILKILSKFGHVELKRKKYNTFRGSKNLNDRNLYVEELLYVLKKV